MREQAQQVVNDAAIALGIVACVFATITMLLTAVALVASSYGLTGVAIGALIAVPGATALICDIPIAAVSDSLGRRPLILIGGLIGAAASVLFAISPRTETLVLAAIGLSVYLTLATSSALAFVTEVGLSTHQPRIQAYNGAVQALSALLGGITGGVLLDRGGPSAAFAGIASLALGAAALAALGRERSPLRRPSIPELVASYPRAVLLFRSRSGLRRASAVTMHTIHLIVVVNAFGALFIVAALGGSAAVAGLAVALRSIVSGVVSALFPMTSALFGLRAPLVVASSVSGLALLLLQFAETLPLAVALIAMQGIGTGLGPATANTLITGATEREKRALGFAAHAIPARISGLALPLMFGWVLQTLGMPTVLTMAAAVSWGLAGVIALGSTGARVEFDRPRSA